ncbi:hypothetical protein [Clostridium botulinum]
MFNIKLKIVKYSLNEIGGFVKMKQVVIALLTTTINEFETDEYQ